jgi:hypothetical protein
MQRTLKKMGLIYYRYLCRLCFVGVFPLFECTVITENRSTLTATHEDKLVNNYCVNVLQLRSNQNLKLINCMHQSLRSLIFTKLFKKLPTFNRIRMSSTIFTTAHHWSPSAATYMLATYCWLQHHFWHFRDYGLLNIEQYKLWSSSLCNFFQPLQPPPPLVLPLGREVNFHTYSKDRLKFSSVYLNPNVFRLQVERQKL